LLNDNNDIIWTLRGGYGTANIIDLLYQDLKFMNKMRLKKKIPYVIGYSDITSLHLFLSQEFGWQTIHGPVFKEIKVNPERFVHIANVIKGIKSITYVGLQALNDSALQNKEVSGMLTGGNLSVIQTTIGTKFEIQTKNKILFLEDCNEKPYKIVRMLNHLRIAHLLDYVQAIVIGNLCDKSEFMKHSINEFAQKLIIPIYLVDVFGHGVYNYPIIYNSDAKIKSENGIIKLNISLF
jgi:muramoyltetrapeptide carboxypeptidase